MSDEPPVVKPPNRIVAVWKGEQEFDTGKPSGPVSRIDGHGETGQGPVDTLLSALATCSAMDVVEIMKKKRTPVASLEVEVTGIRANAVPSPLTGVNLLFRVTGEGIEREQLLKAIELSVTKYCSVRDSLHPRIPVAWELELK
jgi:putative redox protein